MREDQNIGVSANYLNNIDQILFVIHLAIGDFAYMQSAFRAFSNKFPHLQIDIFVLESRCTDDARQWPFLKQEILYDWLEGCGLFRKVYRENYAPHLLRESIKLAQRQNYPLVVCFGTLMSEPTELIARQIAGKNTLAGLIVPIKWYRFKYRRNKKKWWKVLDIKIYSLKYEEDLHISDIYAYWFSQLGGVEMRRAEKYPYIMVPDLWLEDNKNYLSRINFSRDLPIVFINYIAKDPKRSWSLQHVRDLIKNMILLNSWKEAQFIVNATPNKVKEVSTYLGDLDVKLNIFSATRNFYELPAMLKSADLIISVETSIIHLANAVEVPVIALMRLKTPEWKPLNKELTQVIWNKREKENIKDITVEEVLENLY